MERRLVQKATQISPKGGGALHFGRRQIVKGVTYSYYEFTTPRPIDDEAWRGRMATEPRPDWVRPFLSDAPLSCPARDP